MLGPEPRFVYFIYSLLMGLAAVALLPYWILQGLRHGKYLSNLRERLGLSFPSLHKLPSDRGGIPVDVDGTVCILEEFRIPPRFDPNQVRVFATNVTIPRDPLRARLSFFATPSPPPPVATNVAAHYANGQVWVVWNVEQDVLTNCLPTLTAVLRSTVPADPNPRDGGGGPSRMGVR